MEQLIWLISLGLIVGAFGTLIGAGGGFILIPVLLVLYPDKSPETITSISLAVVFFNALSGSLAYARMKRIDFKSGMIFALATIPGAILGAYTTAFIPRNIFNGIFGILMMAAATFLLLKPGSNKILASDIRKNYMYISFTDRAGENYHYAYNSVRGILISLLVGYVSSLLGIGGGIIHVPVMVHLLNFPVHIATATSHFVLAVMALAGTIVHIKSGILSKGVWQTIGLSIGVLIGAQLGARLSNRFHGVWIIRGLALALGIAGIRILMMAFF